MRKNQLIEMLQNIKGNPEIHVWNGFVEDYQPINKELVEVDLHKLSFTGYKERVNIQRKVKDNLEPLSDEELKALYKKHNIGQWELFSYYPPDKEDKGYNKKRVYLIEPKRTGKRTFDRLGDISY